MITDGNIAIDGQSGRHIYENWDASRYERAVLTHLRRVRCTQAGSLLLHAIRRKVTILPFQNPGVCHARTRPVPSRFLGFVTASHPQNWRSATRQGEPAHEACSPTREVGVGTGRGADAVVEFTPGMWTAGSPIYCSGGGAGFAPDEILFHELVHGLQVVSGLLDCRPLVGPLAGYQSRAEFDAVLVTNIYSSETRRPLRRDVQTNLPLIDPAGFYSQAHNAELIADFCRDMPSFSRGLARVPCSFNPLREFYRDLLGLDPSTARIAWNL